MNESASTAPPLAPEPTPSDFERLRERLRERKFAAEEPLADELLAAFPCVEDAEARTAARAGDIVRGMRARGREAGTIDAFLQEFRLTSEEGVALLCLAESLLRVPDADTADRLIAGRIGSADWTVHLGHSESLFVNASTWALMLTGRALRLDRRVIDEADDWLARLVQRAGEPLIRNAMRAAMRILGGQFVMGATIEAALRRCGDAPASFDMLGEAARSDAQADAYGRAYAYAIDAVAATSLSRPSHSNAVSIKLSALDPRFEEAQRARVMQRLYPRLRDLAERAARANVGFTLDAEEADRLELTLDLFAHLARERSLAGWQGLGLAIQAYQKRALPATDWAIALARQRRCRLMLRLVKGAYWDAEVIRAQCAGLADYPVYTRKSATDVSYLACARALLVAGDAIFPQFATHNAHTVAAVLALAGERREGFEFQRLHGMGELLYSVADDVFGWSLPRRVYAPVGRHEALLPYLVRRLLENGANSSFVNRLLDDSVPVERLIASPRASLEHAFPKRHPAIPPPPRLYDPERSNSAGTDLADRRVLDALAAMARALSGAPHEAAPLIAGQSVTRGTRRVIRSPADRRRVLGEAVAADAAAVIEAAAAAARAQPAWDRLGADARAAILERAADAIEAARDRLAGLIVVEAGRTLRDAVDEVREAVDFCRYYALQARRLFAPLVLPGPMGERNELHLHGRGVFACISPWNFPLAIFTGQIAAALAAGNAVLAKPAEQTPFVAEATTRLMHAAGVPADVLNLLPGGGQTGAAVVATPVLAGVAFTGSLATAQAIHRALAAKEGPIATLVAETGGQNAMVVDSTALLEAVVDDVLRSGYASAGQRCSALRVLLVQEDIAEPLLALLAEAIDTLVVGDPADPATDIGPLIDERARETLEAHVAALAASARIVKRHSLAGVSAHGLFMAPVLAEIDDLSSLGREVFGPVIHVKRFAAAALDEVLAELRSLGFGLTAGLHSRIDARIAQVAQGTGAGSLYVNRNMIGAVVGVQPFGGRGLSGTGPKAGGPHYLPRFATEQTISVNTTVTGANAALFAATARED